jgi:hypothetical protein
MRLCLLPLFAKGREIVAFAHILGGGTFPKPCQHVFWICQFGEKQYLPRAAIRHPQ